MLACTAGDNMQLSSMLFAAFAVACLIYGVLIRRLEKAYSQWRPDLWRELSGRGFARQYRHLAKLVDGPRSSLDDPVVAQRAQHVRYAWYIVMASWVGYAASLIVEIGGRDL